MQRERYRIIIALISGDECLQVKKWLERSGVCQVLGMTRDGETCIRQTLRDKPDLVVIGDILRDMEGREVLRQLRSRGISGRMALITNSVQIAYSADVRRDADLCILRPYHIEQLTRWMTELAAAPEEEPHLSYDRAEEAVAWHLQALQIFPTVEGYAHVCNGAALAVWKPEILCRRSGAESLYAVLCGQGAKALPYKTVERRIRTLSKKIFALNDDETLKKYLPLSAVERRRIKNLDLIAALAGHVRMELREKAAAE